MLHPLPLLSGGVVVVACIAGRIDGAAGGTMAWQRGSWREFRPLVDFIWLCVIQRGSPRL